MRYDLYTDKRLYFLPLRPLFLHASERSDNTHRAYFLRRKRTKCVGSAGHPFCRECLSRWQATSHLCPVCRADQRTLAGTEPGAEPGNGAAQEDYGQQDPSLTNILGLIGQLLAQNQASEVPFPPGINSGRQAQFVWRFGNAGNHDDAADEEPAPSDAINIDELQNSLQFVLVRINSLERRPLYWSAQVEELQTANAQLNRCRQGTVVNTQQIAEQIQAYVDTVNAQLDEFLTQAEARQQQQAQRQQISSAYQSASPSAPPLASSLPPHGPTSAPYASSPPQAAQHTAASQAPTTASGSGWQWKWGWGQAPATTLPDDTTHSAQTDANSAQQAVGTGLTNAASAAASAASAIYRRFATAVRAGAAPTGAESADQHAQHDGQAASSSTSSTQQSVPRQQAHAPSAGPSNARQAHRNAESEHLPAIGSDGLPIGRAYEAIRGIFDQHVDPQSRLGQWGAVAQHLGNLHAEMNPADRQQQDAGRMLAAAVNAYSAYRRASAASQQL